MKSAKFWVVVLLIVAATAVLHARGDVDRVPPSENLSLFPGTIGPWTATDFPLDDETLQVLGKGFFLNRVYSPAATPNPSGSGDPVEGAPISLFIGYFPTQRTGQSIHSPQHCLPGAGWVFDVSGVTQLKGPNGNQIEVGEYVISNGPVRQEVLYWYQSHGRSIASDYKAKVYTIADSIRYGRTDAALVRIITPVRPGEDRAEAHRRVVTFAEQVNPLLPAFIPN
jgi:EpsI family protein